MAYGNLTTPCGYQMTVLSLAPLSRRPRSVMIDLAQSFASGRLVGLVGTGHGPVRGLVWGLNGESGYSEGEPPAGVLLKLYVTGSTVESHVGTVREYYVKFSG